jgi:hypothetical protein
VQIQLYPIEEVKLRQPSLPVVIPENLLGEETAEQAFGDVAQIVPEKGVTDRLVPGSRYRVVNLKEKVVQPHHYHHCNMGEDNCYDHRVGHIAHPLYRVTRHLD